MSCITKKKHRKGNGNDVAGTAFEKAEQLQGSIFLMCQENSAQIVLVWNTYEFFLSLEFQKMPLTTHDTAVG